MNSQKNKFEQIVFANGDGGTGRVAQMVREKIFGDFPTIDIPLKVEDRIGSDDACIKNAVEAFKNYGAGFKNSTASNDPEILKRNMGSVNIVMRPLLGAFAMLRMLQGPGRYKHPSGVLRYAYGDFYNEETLTIGNLDSRETAIITQHLDLAGMIPFARLAMQVAKENGLHLVIATKKTIAQSEKLFYERVTQVWKENGLVEGKAEDGGNIWTGDFHHELTDIALATLPVETAEGRTPFAENRFLLVTGNANGDTGSDIVDLQHGNRVMSSTVYCEKSDGSWFTYEELPGGTADKMKTGELNGKNFLNPVGIIFALASAFERVNPEHKEFFDGVRKATIQYITTVPDNELDTEKMIDRIAQETSELLLVS